VRRFYMDPELPLEEARIHEVS